MSVSTVVERLRRHDKFFDAINLDGNQHTDSELAELADCLLAHPDVVKNLWLGRNRLTDETGVKLARYLAASKTIKFMDLAGNQLGLATHLALAAALRVNSSLFCLFLNGNQAVDQTRIDAAFSEALRLNPVRSAESLWWFYIHGQDEFHRLKRTAEQLGHPSLQLLLALLC